MLSPKLSYDLPFFPPLPSPPRFLPGVTCYLALDSLFIGLLAGSLCLSFFPSGLVRISLLTLLERTQEEGATGSVTRLAHFSM